MRRYLRDTITYWSFQTRIVLVVGLAVSLVILAYFSCSLYKSYHSLDSTLHARAQQMAQIQSYSLRTPVWDLNHESALRLLRALIHDPDFAGATVYDEEGRIFVEIPHVGGGEELLSVSRSIVREEETEQRTIGRLALFYSRESVWNTFVIQCQEAILVYILLITILTIAIIVSLRLITSPLMLLTKAMEEYGRGEKTVKVPLSRSRDEIGHLSRTFFKMKSELDAFREGLESLVVERTREVTLAKEAAEQASRVKGEFLANMSHEIRTPLAGMLGMIDLINDGDLSDTQRDYIRTLRFSGETLLTPLTTSMLSTRVEPRRRALSSSSR